MKQWESISNIGESIKEEDINWELVKDKVQSLSLNNDGQIISLPNNEEYIQGKTASATIGSNKIEIESRYIGIIKNGIKIIIRVDEKTNNISLEISE
jgi:hypothetical protein